MDDHPFSQELPADLEALIDGADEAASDVAPKGERRREKQADVLIQLAKNADLFHDPSGKPYADFDVNGHRETWPIRSRAFKRWLARAYFEVYDSAANSEAINNALNLIEAKAHFDGEERAVYVRVGHHGEKLYLDLANETWEAVEIDVNGWRIVDAPPVRFRRAAGMLPLPTPVHGGSVETLRGFLNVQSDDHFILVVSWLLAALRHRGPYPVLVLAGEQGAAKSTFTKVVRALVDPNTAPLRALPREDRDLFIAATNGHVLAFDNCSHLQDWISDTLCRIATGGGFAVRALFTDDDEVLFDASRPILLNGIEDVVTRPDLADRSIFLALQAIPEDKRKAEEELWDAFEVERPFILGALLTAVSRGMRELPHVKLSRLPRMADFARWATACEPALWDRGAFWTAYGGNLGDAVDDVIEADPVAVAVRSFAVDLTESWKGTAKDLLSLLGSRVGEVQRNTKGWPTSPRGLSGRLRRAAPILRKAGIGVTLDERSDDARRSRLIKIAPPDKSGAQPSKSSEPSKCGEISDLSLDGSWTVGDEVGATVQSTVQNSSLIYKGLDDVDGLDGQAPPLSNGARPALGPPGDSLDDFE